MKTFDRKDIISWSNCETAEKYIGKEGYLADTLDALEGYVKGNIIEILDKIDPNNSECFSVSDFSYGCINYSLFLPTDKVKEVEEPKKYRPFKNINELQKCISKDTLTCLDYGIEITDTAKIRQYRLMILGTFTNGIILPLYGALTFEELFKKFKIKINGNWQPFGVLENE